MTMLVLAGLWAVTLIAAVLVGVWVGQHLGRSDFAVWADSGAPIEYDGQRYLVLTVHDESEFVPVNRVTVTQEVGHA